MDKMSRRNVLKLFENNKTYLDEKINSGIKRNRKGRAEIILKDAVGNPIKGARIKVTQKSHEFKYGANLFMLDEMETSEKNELYRKYFSECFNIATIPFYWSDLEPVEGQPRFSKLSEKIYRRPNIELCIEFCRKHNIEPREHCLVYDQYTPLWLIDKTVDEIKEKLEVRMKILAENFKNDILCWEVINETLNTDLTGAKRSAFYKEPDLVEWSFKMAEKYFPDNELTINDAHYNIWSRFSVNHNRSPYYMQIERALYKGARIDAIGMQFHMFVKRDEEENLLLDYYDPKHLYNVMDLYSQFGKPLQITEVTIPAYSNSEEDEFIQAEIIRNLYSIWFSHDNVEQIIYWNLVDGYAAFAPQGDMAAGENYYYGGLLRFDLTPKPAYYMVKDLFQRVWHTEETAFLNKDGIMEFEGFFGKYDVEIMLKDETVKKEINFQKASDGRFEITLK